MEKEILYLVIIIGCFVQMAVVKICNTMFNINKTKCLVENSKIISQNFNVKDIEKLNELMKEGEEKII